MCTLGRQVASSGMQASFVEEKLLGIRWYVSGHPNIPAQAKALENL